MLNARPIQLLHVCDSLPFLHFVWHFALWTVIACSQDIIGYSKLGEEAVIGFVVTVLARVAAMLDDFLPDQRPVVRNT